MVDPSSLVLLWPWLHGLVSDTRKALAFAEKEPHRASPQGQCIRVDAIAATKAADVRVGAVRMNELTATAACSA